MGGGAGGSGEDGRVSTTGETMDSIKIGVGNYLSEVACEVCHQKPSTAMVTDLRKLPAFDVDKDGNKWERVVVHSYHFFCDEHCREPIRYSLAEMAVFSPEFSMIRVGH